MNMSVLGKFAVVMADPPWDIHMELPYGTMSDDEMRRLSIPVLQDDGYIFLWVTGRSDDYSQTLVSLLLDATRNSCLNLFSVIFYVSNLSNCTIIVASINHLK